MNYSKKSAQAKSDKLDSPATAHKHKLKLLRLRIILIAAALVLALLFSVLYGMIRSILDAAPDIDDIQIVPQGYTTSIKDSSGRTIQTLIGENANREYVTLENIPSNLQNAFIAIEDERFYEHDGVDLQGILRAFTNGLENGGTFSEGASTITQQLLKNQVFNGGEENSFFSSLERKLQEQYLAVKVEQKYDKNQILEYYLNTINLGQNTLGVQSASRRYFGKDVASLSLSECAVLAAITQNPSAYNPISHARKNQARRVTVLTRMKEQGYITNTDYNEAIQDPVYKRIRQVNDDISKVTQKPTTYFTDAVIDQVVQDLKSKLGYTETQAYNAIYSRGLTIYTTQDSSMQEVCDSIINNRKYYPKDSKYLLTYQLTVRQKDGTELNYDFTSMQKWYKEKGKTISAYYTKKSTAKKQITAFRKAMLGAMNTLVTEDINLVIQPQASFVLMDQHTGEVKALCGGRGAKTASRTLNRATGVTRQPGSTFKVLSSFLPALDTAGMTLATVQDDAPYYYPGTKKKVKDWYGDAYRGLTSIRTAIADSVNIVAVKTLNEVSAMTAYDYLLNLGFTSIVDTATDNNGKTYTDIALPMALGGLTKGVSNLELTGAFAAIANKGVYHRPLFYTKIVDHDGNVLIDHSSETGTRVMKDSTAWLLTSAMKDVIKDGTGTALKFRKKSMNEAGKTGTSNGNRDLWFVGYTPYLTGGIWCGYDNSATQKETGYHKEMWRDIMEKLNQNYSNKPFIRPQSVTSALICTKCGKLAIDGLCSNAVGGSCEKTEYFSKESVPTETCDCHIKCKICKSSGRLANDNCPESDIYTVVYLQKTENSSPKTASKTADSNLLIPAYLKNSSCNIH